VTQSSSTLARSSKSWQLVAYLLLGGFALVGLLTWMGYQSANSTLNASKGLSTSALERVANQTFRSWHDGDLVTAWRSFTKSERSVLRERDFTSTTCFTTPAAYVATSAAVLANGSVALQMRSGTAALRSVWTYQDQTWHLVASQTFPALWQRCTASAG